MAHSAYEQGMASFTDDLEKIVHALNVAGIAYEVIGGVAVNALWSAKIPSEPAASYKQPPLPGDTRDVSRQGPGSSRRGIRRAPCAGGDWPEHSPGWVPEY